MHFGHVWCNERHWCWHIFLYKKWCYWPPDGAIVNKICGNPAAGMIFLRRLEYCTFTFEFYENLFWKKIENKKVLSNIIEQSVVSGHELYCGSKDLKLLIDNRHVIKSYKSEFAQSSCHLPPGGVPKSKPSAF